MYSSLPTEIRLKTGEVLKPNVSGDRPREIIETCKRVGAKYRVITVLPQNLRGKTDLHGRPYKASQWVFTNLQ